MIYISNELSHHGVKGQKWGVRNGPPYPIEDTTLRKGTKINSISGVSNSKAYKNSGKWLYTYNPDDEWDNKVYKGPFAVYLARNRGKQYLYEHQYEVVKDLKMPTKKERIDEFIKTYNTDVDTYSKEMAWVQKQLKQYNVGSKESQNVDFSKLKTDADYKAAYEVFNHAMENMNAFKMTKAYAKTMSTKYDAMVDDNNQGVYNEAHDPVIIFRANQALKPVAKARTVTYNEILQNYKDVHKELDKKGVAVKL